MKKLNKEEILEYLQKVLDCEANIMNYDIAIKKLNGAINNLCIPRTIEEPVRNLVLEPAKPQRAKKTDYDGIKFKDNLKWSAILGYGGVAINLLIGFPAVDINTIFMNLILFIAGEICFGSIATSLLSVVTAIGNVIVKEVKANKENKKRQLEYNVKMRDYKAQVSMYENDYQRDIDNYQVMLDNESQRLEVEESRRNDMRGQLLDLRNLKSITEKNLFELYCMNILPHDYQHFVAVASFYKNLKNGLTHSLELVPGDQGAYNLYEKEDRNSKVIATILMSANALNKTIGAVGNQITGAIGVASNQITNQIRSSGNQITNTVGQMGDSLYRQNESIHSAITRGNTLQSDVSAKLNQLDGLKDIKSLVQRELTYQEELSKDISRGKALVHRNIDRLNLRP